MPPVIDEAKCIKCTKCAAIAAIKPAMPPPTTNTSQSSIVLSISIIFSLLVRLRIFIQQHIDFYQTIKMSQAGRIFDKTLVMKFINRSFEVVQDWEKWGIEMRPTGKCQFVLESSYSNIYGNGYRKSIAPAGQSITQARQCQHSSGKRTVGTSPGSAGPYFLQRFV